MYIKVRVYPGVKREKVIEKTEVQFEIHTTARAERNLANNRTRELLAERFGCTLKQIKLISGHHTPSKLFDVVTR